MIDFFVGTIAKLLLWLRYRIRISGMEEVAARGKGGILFLPNHPALIDPVVLYAYMWGKFRPSGFADKDQVDRFLIRVFARRWGVRTIPSMAKYGPSVRGEIEEVLDESIKGLKAGENLLLWPAGRIYRSYKESLSANSSVERILKECPDVRIVLIRTRGLWGSSFGLASGKEPNVAKILVRGFFLFLGSGIFFAPRREVNIEFFEPEDLPQEAKRNLFNRYLEEYYNADAPPNTYVPYTIWEREGTVRLPEPALARHEGAEAVVPEATRQIVLDYLSEIAGIHGLQDGDDLAAELGMDSLARAELMVWIEKEFGFGQVDADAMRTVGDVMLAACGEFVSSGPVSLKPVPPGWFKDVDASRLAIGEGRYVTDIFLREAGRTPSKVVIADQVSGVKTYRDIVIACMVLRGPIANLRGEYVGIMIPASAGAMVFYLATLFAGKTPVMVNWTAGPRNMVGSLDLVGVEHILTSKAVVEKIESQGTDLSGLRERFVFAETLAGGVSRWSRLGGWLAGHLSWASLKKAKISETAVVIFTSGSETVPKAVPLTHANLISNIRDVVGVVEIRKNDRLLGFLPPFHSFGLTVTMLLPLCGGAHTVYHPNPVEGGVMAQLIEAYGVSVLIGTPTFLNGIVRVGTKKQLSTLRLVVTGAEKCPEKVYDLVRKKCEHAVILEGYGVTECSPIVSINDEHEPQPFTIGKVLPSLDYVLLEAQTGEVIRGAGTGVLSVRGPSVFSGYLKYQGKSPFVEIEGKRWYSTGDLVSVDEKGVLTFCGRLKRFIKLGGEMISLPAIEAVLEGLYAYDSDEGPVLAVEATEDEQHPELVLFTVRQIDRETANQQIREAGFSGLYSIRRVIRLNEIPLLGTGKTDYRALKERFGQDNS